MLSRTHRFHGLGSLNFAYKQGQTVRGPLLSLRFVRNPRRAQYRVAVVVSRKVNKSAVARNRIRRRIYEAFRLHAASIHEPYDLVFTVFSDQAADIGYQELGRQVQALLKKANVLMEPGSQRDIVESKGKTE